MLHKLKGAGLPNVYLDGGVTIEDSGEDQTTAYANLDELYREIARAIALRHGAMSPGELRFLRKRLGMSQADVAELGGKTEQAVAKWEKGVLPVPKAEANLLRLSVLSRFGTKEEISRVVSQLANASSKCEQYPYAMRFIGNSWISDESLAIQLSGKHSFMKEAGVVIATGGLTDSTIDMIGSRTSSDFGWSDIGRDVTLAGSGRVADRSMPLFPGQVVTRRLKVVQDKRPLTTVGTGARNLSLITDLR